MKYSTPNIRRLIVPSFTLRAVGALATLLLSVTVIVPMWYLPARAQNQTTRAATFTNPFISREAADPWIVRHDGMYYFTATTGKDIFVQKSSGITGLQFAKRVTVWKPPANGLQSKDIWAPELHFINGKWYIYYAADDGSNENHRMYVLESKTSDPQGAYIDRGKIYDKEEDRWAIDGTVLRKPDGSLYFVWSGWDGFVDKVAQNIYIAPMSNPWTIGGRRVLISKPERLWEGWINEGPEALVRNGKIFIIYSANGSWTPDYCLGALVNTDADVLNPRSWVKSHDPVFTRQPGVFGPGHNSFTVSPDGSQDWIIYHATDKPTDGWRNRRPRAQRFTLDAADGTPNFGYPLAPSVRLELPSGEVPTTRSAAMPQGTGTGLRAEYYDNQDFTNFKLTRTDPTINYTWGLLGGSGAPAASMGGNTFSVRWSGQLEPRHSETYTFTTYSDDGIRLWINNQLVIEHWSPHTATVKTGAISLVAGKRYDIRVEYYENVGSAIARLEWSSPSQPHEVIPPTQLYPTTTIVSALTVVSPIKKLSSTSWR